MNNINAINSINTDFISGYKFMLMSDIAILGSEKLDCSNEWLFNLKEIFKLDVDKFEDKLDIIKKSKIFFIKRDFVEFFITKFYNYLQNNLTIITHCSDIPVDNTQILNLPKIKKWYALNTMIKHHKLITIPIGLTTHEKKHGDMKLLKSIVDMKIRKSNLLYINFNVNTNKKIRYPIMQLWKLKGFKTIEGNKPLNQGEYWKNLSSHKFCIAPPGNGFDCHRIWECIYLDTIPIVIKNDAFNKFRNMKILFINDWNDITSSFLEEKYIEFCKSKFDNEMAYTKYWENEIIND